MFGDSDKSNHSNHSQNSNPSQHPAQRTHHGESERDRLHRLHNEAIERQAAGGSNEITHRFMAFADIMQHLIHNRDGLNSNPPYFPVVHLTDEAVQAIQQMQARHEISSQQASSAIRDLRSQERDEDLMFEVLVDIARAFMRDEVSRRFTSFADIIQSLIQKQKFLNKRPPYAPVVHLTDQALRAIHDMQVHHLITPQQAADANRHLNARERTVDLMVRVLVDIAGAFILPRHH